MRDTSESGIVLSGVISSPDCRFRLRNAKTVRKVAGSLTYCGDLEQAKTVALRWHEKRAESQP